MNGYANQQKSNFRQYITVTAKVTVGKDMYGYEMIDTLEKSSNNIFELKVGTLYPLLHSMVQAGYLTSYDQDVNGKGKLRKYYRVTSSGQKY